MALLYSSFVSEIATITAISSSILVNGDTNFQPIMPGIIDYAEGRIYRDLDLPYQYVGNLTTYTSTSQRTVSLSTANGTLLVLQDVAVYLPAGSSVSTLPNVTRVPLVPTSIAVLNTIYPSGLSSNCGQPQYYVRVSDSVIGFGPSPDQVYQLEVVGTVRPAPLSASNPETWLTDNVPELLIAAGMVFASGYMRDFGAQSDNPQMAQSWESQYQLLMKSASVDSFRMKFQSEGWSQNIPAPQATPPRA